MQPIDLADTLERSHWETLRAFCTPSADPRRLSEPAVARLLRDELLELRHDRASLTEKGRRVVVCGSPRLWNS